MFHSVLWIQNFQTEWPLLPKQFLSEIVSWNDDWVLLHNGTGFCAFYNVSVTQLFIWNSLNSDPISIGSVQQYVIRVSSFTWNLDFLQLSTNSTNREACRYIFMLVSFKVIQNSTNCHCDDCRIQTTTIGLKYQRKVGGFVQIVKI